MAGTEIKKKEWKVLYDSFSVYCIYALYCVFKIKKWHPPLMILKFMIGKIHFYCLGEWPIEIEIEIEIGVSTCQLLIIIESQSPFRKVWRKSTFCFNLSELTVSIT